MEKGRILELAVANMRYMYLGTVNRYEGIVFFFWSVKINEFPVQYFHLGTSKALCDGEFWITISSTTVHI
jgi:hypothetical protein